MGLWEHFRTGMIMTMIDMITRMWYPYKGLFWVFIAEIRKNLLHLNLQTENCET